MSWCPTWKIKRNSPDGYGILLRIQQISGDRLEVQQGSLYSALYRLEHQGLIDSEWGESENNLSPPQKVGL